MTSATTPALAPAAQERPDARSPEAGSPEAHAHGARANGAFLNFTMGDFSHRLCVAREPAAAQATESATLPLLNDSARRIEAELDFASRVLLERGFVEPPGRAAIPEDPLALVNWNWAYSATVDRWIAEDPEWRHIGGAERCAAELIRAGVGIQLALMAVRDGVAPMTTATSLHNLSVEFGEMRVHLRTWLNEPPRSLTAQRERAAGLKTAAWHRHVESVILQGLDAGRRIEAIVEDVQAHLARSPAFIHELPSQEAVRAKVQRVRQSRWLEQTGAARDPVSPG